MSRAIEDYVSKVRFEAEIKYGSAVALELNRLRWRQTVARYMRVYGRQASGLVHEVANPNYKEIASIVFKKADSLKSFNHIIDILNGLAATVSMYRTRRFLKAAIKGTVIGIATFIVVFIVLTARVGTPHLQL